MADEPVIATINSELTFAKAAQYLIDGGQFASGETLMLCGAHCELSGGSWWDGNLHLEGVYLTIIGPRFAYDSLSDSDSQLHKDLSHAFDVALGRRRYIDALIPELEAPVLREGWRDEFAERFRAQETANQAKDHPSSPPHRWQGLGFRSVTEIRVAQALDAAGVMFFPLPSARVTVKGEQRGTRVPDFLVCQNGKWGIMEVNGLPYHPPGTAVQDAERARLFKQYGMKIVEPYDAHKCYQNPTAVVREFLALLERNG